MVKRCNDDRPRKSVLPAGWDAVNLDRYVNDAVRAMVSEAERAFEGALAVLKLVGVFEPGVTSQPIKLNSLLKLSACVRLFQWEQAGLAGSLGYALPTSTEVWSDLLLAPRTGQERFPGRDLAALVFGIWLRNMAWHPPTTSADVAVGSVRASNLVDELADFLFAFRNLVNQNRPSGPEEENHG